MIKGRSEWQIVDAAVVQYVERMSAQDRRAIEGLAKRVAEKAGKDRSDPTPERRAQAGPRAEWCARAPHYTEAERRRHSP